MKMKLLCCLMMFLLALPVAARPPKGETTVPSSAIIDNSTFIDVNRILMFVTNHGNFGRDLAGVFGYDYGTWFPYTGDTAAIQGNIGKAGDFSPNYASGLWVGCKVGEDTRIIISEYSSEYVPGPMAGGTFSPDNPDFRVYKLYRDSLASNPNADYLNWPVDQGAPVDGNGAPDFVGDQMLWCVYNDADPDAHDNDAGETAPLGLEVKQTVFGFDRLGSLGNMVFIKYQVFNKGGNTLEDCYFSIWYDPDLGTSGDDLVGCDTTIGLGFVYNETNDDGQYGAGPPAMGCDFFQGPLRARTAADTTIDGEDLPIGRAWGQEYPDSVNFGMVSFNKYINGTDPDNFNQTYGFMQGLTKDLDPYVFEGDTLLFVQSGDPVTGEGDVDGASADRRWMQTTGPVTFAPGDSTEILTAMIVGQGSNNLSSITVLKQLDKFAQKLYEEGFNPPAAPAKPNVTVAALSGEITLSWDDTSEVDAGEFPFEGYSVWQGESPSGPWTLLSTYDVINDRQDATNPLIDTLFDLESGTFQPAVMRSVKDAGLSHSYRTLTNALTNESLKDLTEYYFRVSAFSFGYFKQNGDVVPNGDRFLESARDLIITPASPLAGITPMTESQDHLDVTHPAGVSDGVIEPIVVDPVALTGHQYRLTFSEVFDTTIEAYDHSDTDWIFTTLTDTCDLGWDAEVDTAIVVFCVDTTIDVVHEDIGIDTTETITIVWHVYDATAGTWVLQDQTNQEGDDNYFVFDGILLKVQGPPVGFKSFQVVANNAGPIDPPEAGAADFQGFPVPLDADGTTLRPTDAQQATGDGHWFFHTGDDGGTSGGGTRGSYDAFITRVLRGSAIRFAQIVGFDYEMRFTGSNDDPLTNGSWAWEWATDGSSYWVPFELWRTGIGTPDDETDDVRLLPFIFGDGDAIYNMGSYGNVNDGCGPDGCEHSVSGGDDDPYTNWIYWRLPGDDSPGEAGYLAYEADMIADPVNHVDDATPIIDRTVLVNWNGGGPTLADINMTMPEVGTIFRIVTNKPNLVLDTFFFTAPAPLVTATENDLDLIKAVPNPFYLSGGYDPNPGSYAIKFHHLPAECTITIYNLGGDLIRTIEKDDATSAETSWDVLTETGLPVASGIYIYVVDAPGFGTKIGKMAVFVQKEVLDIY